MSNYSPSRPGLNYATTGSPTTDDELFLKVFSGEVMTVFQRECVFKDLTRVRTIEHGKSASFPIIGSASAAYHTPGTELTGQQIKGAEKVILIDGLMVADTFVAVIDELKNHFDVRQPYAIELGRALARRYDENILSKLLEAARTDKPITGDAMSFGGSTGGIGAAVNNSSNLNIPAACLDATLRHANAASNAAVLVNLLWTANKKFDEKNVPDSDRFAAVRPAQYYLIMANTNGSAEATAPFYMSRDYAGTGSVASKMAPVIGNIQIVKSNAIPDTANIVRAASGEQKNAYSVVTCGGSAAAGAGGAIAASTSRRTQAVVFQREAVGTLQLLDVQSEMEPSKRHQGTLLLSKYASGHDVLKPSLSLEITNWDGSAN